MNPAPSPRLVLRLAKWAQRKYDAGPLSILDRYVEDVLCQRANRINNGGLQSQIKFLLRHWSRLELKRTIRSEHRNRLKRVPYVASVCNPKKMVSLKAQKKKRRHRDRK